MTDWRSVQREFVRFRDLVWDAMVASGCSPDQVSAAMRHLYAGVHPSRLSYLSESVRVVILRALCGRR